jgi:hypothetical protein
MNTGATTMGCASIRRIATSARLHNRMEPTRALAVVVHGREKITVFNTAQFRRITMMYRTLAASTLALGLLSPMAFADGSNSTDGRGCPEIRQPNSQFLDCQGNYASPSRNEYGIAAPSARPRGSIGDFIDETAEEKNQRSNK